MPLHNILADDIYHATPECIFRSIASFHQSFSRAYRFRWEYTFIRSNEIHPSHNRGQLCLIPDSNRCMLCCFIFWILCNYVHQYMYSRTTNQQRTLWHIMITNMPSETRETSTTLNKKLRRYRLDQGHSVDSTGQAYL